MEEPKTSAPIRFQDIDAGLVDDDLAAPRTKRMPEEPTRDTPLRKRLNMCPDKDVAANTPAPVHQFIKENSSQNSKAPLNPALWNDTTREVYEHLKDRAEKLEDAPIDTGASSTRKDIPKFDAPFKDNTGNIYETLPGRIQSTLKQLHDQYEQKETKEPSAELTSSRLTTGSDPKRSKSKQSGASMRISAVKGTKAERLREYMKYFPKPPLPTSSPPSSPGSLGNCSLSSEGQAQEGSS